MQEAEIQRLIQLEATTLGCRLFRNQIGKYKLPSGKWLSSGLVVGSSDLIGWTPVVIAGKSLAIFTAVEVKSETGRASAEQKLFLKAVESSGGIAILAKSVEDFTRGIDDFRNQFGLPDVGLRPAPSRPDYAP